MIQVEHLTKKYGEYVAVNDISFSIHQGEIVGFLGPNGAGKSTTMNMLTGYISSTNGSVHIAGIDILEDPDSAKRHIGYLPEQPPLYMNMTVYSYLKFVCNLKKIKNKKEVQEQIQQACEKVQITHVKDRIIANLSKGYRQRVGLAQTLISNPDVLILDEPTVGLDPKQIIEIRDLIRELGRDHTVILSSHILSEIQAVCDRIIIINQGKIVADDTEKNLSHSLQSDSCILLRAAGNAQEVQAALEDISSIEKLLPDRQVEENSFDFKIYPVAGQDPRKDIFGALSSAQLPILELKSNELTLEDIFLRMVSGEFLDAVQEDEEDIVADNSDALETSLEEETLHLEESVVDEVSPFEDAVSLQGEFDEDLNEILHSIQESSTKNDAEQENGGDA